MVRISGIALINACKVATAVSLGAFAKVYKFKTLRSPLYCALHGSYLAWWAIHQRLSPKWGSTVFPEAEMSWAAVAMIFASIGPGYALPGWVAFKSDEELTAPQLVGSVALFSWGSLINAAADFYKDGSKSAAPGVTVTTGPFRLARHINWFGDWLRYASFAVAAGGKHPAAYFPLAWTVLFNLSTTAKRREDQSKRGGADVEKWQASTPAFIPVRLLF